MVLRPPDYAIGLYICVVMCSARKGSVWVEGECGHLCGKEGERSRRPPVKGLASRRSWGWVQLKRMSFALVPQTQARHNEEKY